MLGAALFAGLAGLSAPAPLPVAPASELEVTALAVPSGVSARYPRLERDSSGTIVLAWTERGSADAALRCAALAPGAPAFGAAGEVAHGEGWFVNWADCPVVAPGPGDRALGLWLEKNGAGTYAYGVRFRLRSDAAWGEPRWLHDDQGPVEHGFVATVALDDGWAAVWLDGRKGAEAAQEGGHGGHNEHAGAEMSLYLRTVSAGGELGPELLLDGRVCDCCQTALARTADGALVCAYRDRGDDETRDVSIVRVVDGRASEPRAVHQDGWRVAGCPVNGPSLAAAGERVACAWYTEAPGARVLLALSADGGRSFGAPVRVDEGGAAGRVSTAWLADGSLLVTWLEELDAAEGRGAWRAQRYTATGEPAGSAVTVAATETARSSGFLRLVSEGDGALAAWTVRDGDFELRAARLRVAR
ncbi:MAG: sialidase family protein [Planctomycetota bacterium]